MTIWVVYFNPSDFPGLYVLRAQRPCSNGEIEKSPGALTADTLDEIRELIPPGLTRIPRFPEDDPVIVECWL